MHIRSDTRQDRRRPATAQVLTCLPAESREEGDDLFARALAHGGADMPQASETSTAGVHSA